MKLNRVSKFYTVVIIGMIIAFISTYICGTSMCIIPRWFNIALALIPVICFVFLFLYSLKREVKKPFIVASFCLIFLFFILTVLNCFWIAMKECTTEITDTKYYQRVLEFYDYPESELGVFPESIPAEAKNVEFYECPVPLNGKSRVMLKIQLDDAVFNQKADEIQKNLGNPVLSTNNKNIVYVDDKEYFLDSDFITYFGLNSVLDDWNFFVYENQKNSDEWEHGIISGAAINYEALEIVYYAFEW